MCGYNVILHSMGIFTIGERTCRTFHCVPTNFFQLLPFFKPFAQSELIKTSLLFKIHLTKIAQIDRRILSRPLALECGVHTVDQPKKSYLKVSVSQPLSIQMESANPRVHSTQKISCHKNKRFKASVEHWVWDVSVAFIKSPECIFLVRSLSSKQYKYFRNTIQCHKNQEKKSHIQTFGIPLLHNLIKIQTLGISIKKNICAVLLLSFVFFFVRAFYLLQSPHFILWSRPFGFAFILAIPFLLSIAICLDFHPSHLTTFFVC